MHIRSLNSTANYFWGQHIGQKVNIGRISKIITFHPIDLKFEEDLYCRSLNSTTNYFWGQHRSNLSIFIRFTWNLKRSCTFGHLIQLPIIFEVKFVFWILMHIVYPGAFPTVKEHVLESWKHRLECQIQTEWWGLWIIWYLEYRSTSWFMNG